MIRGQGGEGSPSSQPPAAKAQPKSQPPAEGGAGSHVSAQETHENHTGVTPAPYQHLGHWLLFSTIISPLQGLPLCAEDSPGETGARSIHTHPHAPSPQSQG